MRAPSRLTRGLLCTVIAIAVPASSLPAAFAAPAPVITRADLDNGGRPCAPSQGDAPLRLGYFADRLEATAQVAGQRAPSCRWRSPRPTQAPGR